MMDKIKNIFSNPRFRRIITISSFVLIVILIIVLIRLNVAPTVQAPLTVPVISPSTTPGPVEPLDTTNPFNPKQELIFSWGVLSPTLPATLKNYRIVLPLVNEASINQFAGKFGFTALNRVIDEDASIWGNDTASVVGSVARNQIFYNSTAPIPIHTNTYTKDQAANLARNIVSDMFGAQLIGTLDPNPEVKYLALSPNAEDEPDEVLPEVSNLVSVDFRQNLNSLPLLNSSKKGETISVVLDTAGKVYLMYVYGGYYSFSETGSVNLMSFSELQSAASKNALRISYAQGIDSESVFTNAKVIKITVSRVTAGYYQRSDNDIFPVFIIQGIMSASGTDPFQATFIVPAAR